MCATARGQEFMNFAVWLRYHTEAPWSMTQIILGQYVYVRDSTGPHSA